MRVKIIGKHVVFPDEPTWEGEFPLSELDQTGVITHSSIIFFYDRPNHEDWVDPSKNKVITTLKDSLSQALVPFYPLAGRLSWANGRRMELECNANNSVGAEIIEAESSDKITDFGDFVDSSKSMFKHLLAPFDYVNTPIDQIPLLSVQVTRFECGGISLGIQISHMIADGRSAFHFFKEWAHLARGETVIKLAPFLDRFAPSQIPTTGNTEHVDSFYLTQNDEQKRITDEVLVSPTLMILTSDNIESLKKEANQELGLLSRPYSRFEVITAHLVRCITRVRDSELDQVIPLSTLCEIRARLDPPLPPSYFGNALFITSTSIDAYDLITKPLSYVCSKVREASAKVSNETVHKYIELIRGTENLSEFHYIQDRGALAGNLKSSNQSGIGVNCWLNLFQHLDFGWGDEIYTGRPFGAGLPGIAVISPHNPFDGSVKIAVWLEHEDMSSKFVDFMRAGL